jgi:hypothetical protein
VQNFYMAYFQIENLNIVFFKNKNTTMTQVLQNSRRFQRHKIFEIISGTGLKRKKTADQQPSVCEHQRPIRRERRDNAAERCLARGAAGQLSEGGCWVRTLRRWL